MSNSEIIQLTEEPLIVVIPRKDKVFTYLRPRGDDRYEHFGLLICDIIRHTARCFDVSEDEVFEWVKREYARPTTDITEPS